MQSNFLFITITGDIKKLRTSTKIYGSKDVRRELVDNIPL